MVPRGLAIIVWQHGHRPRRRRRCAAPSCFHPSRASPIATRTGAWRTASCRSGRACPIRGSTSSSCSRARPTRSCSCPTPPFRLHGLGSIPAWSAIPVGGTVEFKNDDRVPHTLYIEKATTLMPPTPTPAGADARAEVLRAGEYRVRDEEYPHIDGTVLVVQTPYVARLDEKGQLQARRARGQVHAQGLLARQLGADAAARGHRAHRAR